MEIFPGQSGDPSRSPGALAEPSAIELLASLGKSPDRKEGTNLAFLGFLRRRRNEEFAIRSGRRYPCVPIVLQTNAPQRRNYPNVLAIV
jgi:hypothetical protein